MEHSGDAGNPSSLRFYDWGDSVVAHPFAAMLVPSGSPRAAGPPTSIGARDAYLAGFDDLGDRVELVETLELGCRVAKVARALVWERALLAGADRGHDGSDEFARAPLATLVSLLDEDYLGGA